MIINKIDYGKEITITSHNEENQKVELKTRVVELTDQKDLQLLQKFRNKYPDLNFCIAEPIREKSLLINFQSDVVISDVTTVLHNNPYRWKDVLIINVRFPVFGSAHLLASNENCRSINRRKAYRVSLTLPGTVQIEEQSYRATIADVSEIGIAVIVRDVQPEIGKKIDIEFTDPKTEKTHKLRATVIWGTNTEHGNYKVGCSFANKSLEMKRIVHARQVEQMSRGEDQVKKLSVEPNPIEPLAEDILVD